MLQKQDNTAAHPRVSGENYFPSGRQGISRGSSPRERGKPVGTPNSFKNIRLIPA